jgi:Tape measure protein
MAGTSSRDVELVVRARDESSKAVEAIVQALGTLTDAMSSIDSGAAKTDGLIGQLGSAMGDLQRQVQGLQSLAGVASQIERAAAAVGRLENTAVNSAKGLESLRAKQEELAQSGAALADNLERTRSNLDAERGALTQSERAYQQLGKQVDAAGQAYSRSLSAARRAKGQNDELNQAYRDQRGVLLSLVEQQSAMERPLSAQREIVDRLVGEYGSLNKQVTANATAQEVVGRNMQVANEAFERTAAAVEKAKTDLAGMQDAGAKAGAALGGVAINQEAIRDASQRTAASINEVAEALKRQQAAGGGADASLGPAAANTSAYRQQIQAVQAARQAWEQAREEATRLGSEMAKTAEPSRELNAQFVITKAAASGARASYEEQAAALNRLKGVLQTGYAAFDQSAEAMRQEGQSSYAAAAGLMRILEVLPQIAPQVRPLTASIRELIEQLLRVPEAAGAAAHGSSESLSVFHRLRDEVVGLTATYLGLYGAIEAVGEVIKTVATVQSATSRLGVVFDGDTARARQDIDFLMGEAERLGISFTTLSDEYTKVAIAAREMGISNETARRVFLSLAEAGRVIGMTVEDTTGLFRGLAESIDRGTLNARNFNLQIAMRLPGAMSAMAEAVGVSVEKFTELQKAGGGIAVTEDILDKFAENMKSRFDKELPAALDNTTAQLGRLQALVQEGMAHIGEGGFADALKSLLDDLTKILSSDAGTKGFQELGQVMGGLTNVLKLAVDNFGLLVKVGEAWVALKIAGYVLSLASANGALGASLVAAQADVTRLMGAFAGLNVERLTGSWTLFRAQVAATGAALAEMGAEGAVAAAGTALVDAAMTTMNGIMVGVAATARAMWVAVGGFPGLLLTAATFVLADLLGKWMTGIDQATGVMQSHDELMQRIVEDYHKAADAADDFAEKALKSSSTQVVADLIKLHEALADAQKQPAALAEPTVIGGTAQSQQALARLLDAFQQGKMAAVDFKKAVNDLATADPSLDKTVIAQMQDVADKARKVELAIQKDEAWLRQIAGTATAADKALLGLANAASQVNDAFGTGALDRYNDALQKLTELAPDLKPQEKLKQNLDSAQQDAKAALSALKLTDAQIQQALTGQGVAGIADPKVLDLIKQAVAKYQAVLADLKLEEQKKVTEALPGDAIANARQYIWSRENAGRDPAHARNAASSASGFGQFTDKTWVGYFNQLFPQLIDLTADQKLLYRADKEVAAKIQDLADKQNALLLVQHGQQPSLGNLYLSHFLGMPDALRALDAAKTTPNASAAGLLPGDARANPNVFYHRGANGKPDKNSPLTLAQLIAWAQPPGSGAGATVTASGLTEQQEFDAKIAELIQALHDAAKAVGQSPRDAFVQSKLTEAQRSLKPDDTFSPAQQASVASAAGALFDANEAQREKDAVAALALELNNLRHGEEGLTREQYVQAAATKNKIDLLTDEGKQYAKIAGQIYDLQSQQKAFNNVTGLSQQRNELAEQIQGAFKEGDTDKVRALQQEISDITAKLKAALPDAKAFAEVMGDQKMIATLDEVTKQLGTVKVALTDSKQINQELATGMSSLFKTAVDAIGDAATKTITWHDALQKVWDTARSFAADFLEKIAQMILQQQLLNALSKLPLGSTISNAVNQLAGGGAGGAGLTAAGTTLTTAGTTLTTAATALLSAAAALGGSSSLSGLSGLTSTGGFGNLLSSIMGSGGADAIGEAAEGIPLDLIGLFHSGGVVGNAGGMSRSIWPGVFASARRMHTGGIAGLMPNEVPTILQRGEEVLDASNPRHIANQGGGGPSQPPVVNLKNINAFSYEEVMTQALNTTPGQQAFVNFVRQNQRAVRSALGT